jgi:hypothetical protein
MHLFFICTLYAHILYALILEHGRSAQTNSSYSTCIASGVLRHLFLNSTNSAVAHFGEGTTTASATELGELSLFLKRRSKI